MKGIKFTLTLCMIAVLGIVSAIGYSELPNGKSVVKADSVNNNVIVKAGQDNRSFSKLQAFKEVSMKASTIKELPFSPIKVSSDLAYNKDKEKIIEVSYWGSKGQVAILSVFSIPQGKALTQYEIKESKTPKGEIFHYYTTPNATIAYWKGNNQGYQLLFGNNADNKSKDGNFKPTMEQIKKSIDSLEAVN